MLSLALLVTSRGVFSECIPGDNCKLPDCRCWDDPKVPGGLAVKDVPQMVIVSFAYGINVANAGAYQALFDGMMIIFDDLIMPGHDGGPVKPV